MTTYLPGSQGEAVALALSDEKFCDRVRVTADRPIAEGAHDGLWFVAYAAPCGGVDVLAHRFRRVPQTTTATGATIAAGVDLGACVWCGRVREGRWSGVVGEPPREALARAWQWVQASALRSAATPR